MDTSGNTGANALVGSGAVSVFQRAQHCPLGPRSRALRKPALLAEVGGHLPRLPWDWFQFPNAKPACWLGVTQAHSHQGSVSRRETRADGGRTWPLPSFLGPLAISSHVYHLLPCCRDPHPARLWMRTALQRIHGWLKSSKDLRSESPGSRSNDFSVPCATKIPPYGGPLGVMCPAFLPEVEGTLSPLHIRRNLF